MKINSRKVGTLHVMIITYLNSEQIGTRDEIIGCIDLGQVGTLDGMKFHFGQGSKLTLS